MSCFRKFLLLLRCLSLFASPLLSADGNLDEGDFLAAKGLHDEAVTSWLRFIFLHADDPRESAVCARIARACAASGDDEAALRWSVRAVAKARGEPERRERAFTRVELLLALGRYEPAVLELGLLDGLALSKPERGRCWFLRGVAAVYLGRFGEAAGLFGDYFSLTASYPAETRRRVLALLAFGAKSVPLDPDLSGFLSYLLPGSGQAYSGEWLQGLNSLLVTGAAGTLVGWAAASGNYFDAAAVVLFVFTRFYTGGPAIAHRLAVERNEDRKLMIERAVFDLLAR